MSSLLKSVALQIEAEKTLEQEKVEARIMALQDLRWEFCRILDDLIAYEEQRFNQELQDSTEL